MPPIPVKKAKKHTVSKQVEEVVKTPFKGDSEEHKLMAMDYLVEKYAADRIQLCFLGWDHEDDEGFHHFKVIYTMIEKKEETVPECEQEICMSCSS